MRYIYIVIALIGLCACSQTEKTEAITAEITAAQMEGRNAARDIILHPWSDTTGIARRINKARAPRLKYDSLGHTEASAAFDSAFNNTIRTVRPVLAKKIKL